MCTFLHIPREVHQHRAVTFQPAQACSIVVRAHTYACKMRAFISAVDRFALSLMITCLVQIRPPFPLHDFLSPLGISERVDVNRAIYQRVLIPLVFSQPGVVVLVSTSACLLPKIC